MADRQYSLAHLTALSCSPPELIRIAADAGYQYVGLRNIPFGLPGEPRYELAEDPVLHYRTRTALAETGVRLLDIELARITDEDPRRYLPELQAGADLGASHVLTSIWTTDRNRAIDNFGVLCDLALPLGLTVNLEFVAWSNCVSLADALDIVTKSGRRNVGMMIDTFHFHHAGGQLAELRMIPREWCNYAHISDDRSRPKAALDEVKRRGREERLFPGEGNIDIGSILGHLPARVICAIELPHLARLQSLGPAAFARQCLVETKRYLARAVVRRA